ncbi:MAG: 16S rRNA (cytidine(1402)-2'-O)-methyltransferase [Thermodesulfovibrionales bacterium]|nr:16S rRNA (cytidine(1402)-2'-O)-methyltransferase [Thermodesulfovibrionales bacterium]
MANEIQGFLYKEIMPGVLYIVATPIGNLEDITLRALRVLKDVDFIAAEDTRHSLKLLNHYDIEKPLLSYWSEREKVRSDEIINLLKQGRSVALISDAGTPGISDPGAVLIGRAIDEGLTVVPVPGASALIAALSISGLPTEEFTFCGFLPPRRAERIRKLELLKFERRTLVFYEAPHRLLETVEDFLEVFGGERRVAIFKELTKIHEQVFRGSIQEVYSKLLESVVAGEYVIVLEGSGKILSSFEEALEEVKVLMKQGMGRKEAVKTVAEHYNLSSKELYDRSLKEQ